MSTTDQDAESTILPNPPTNGPYVPSDVEARNYYHGLPSKPHFIARSSPDVWTKPSGPEPYLEPKELTPLGRHLLNEVWEKTFGPAMDRYLQEKGVQSTSMNPLRIGKAGQSSPPAVIFIGVNLRSLSLTNLASRSLSIADLLLCRTVSTMFMSKFVNPSSPAPR